MQLVSQKSDDIPDLRCYTLPKSGRGLHVWYDSLPGQIRAAIDAALESLEYEDDWNDLPQVKRLRGACRGLTEILVDVENRHFRILGFEGPWRGAFTLLFGFEKPRGSRDYGAACVTAHHRRRGVEHDARRAAPCTFP